MRFMTAIATVALAALTTACETPQAAEARLPQAVRTQVAALASPSTGVRYSASIEAYQQVPLAFKASGYVDDVLQRGGADGRLRAAQAGDQVSRGLVLARVRESDYRDRVEQGQSRLLEAQAGLTKARLDLERAKALFAADSLIKPDLDAAQAAYDSAEARVTTARKDVDLASSALRDCALVAPMAGVILERRIEIGTLASAGMTGFVLGDLSSVKARFGIPDVMIRTVALGSAIDVAVDAISAETFSGRVTAIAPAADPQSRVFDVEVTIANQSGRLRPGMIGTVALSTVAAGVSAEPQVTVPLTAIVRADAATGRYAVLVIESRDGRDTARMRPVDLGEVTGSAIVVRSGLAAGEHVVISGATLLTDGEIVRVIS